MGPKLYLDKEMKLVNHLAECRFQNGIWKDKVRCVDDSRGGYRKERNEVTF